MPYRWMAVATLTLCSGVALACDYTDRHECKDEIARLVGYRGEAIEYAFGNVFEALPPQIEIRFVRAGEEQYERFSGRVAYDSSQQVLVVPVNLLNSQMPMPLRWAASYWPYYRSRQYQEMFPLIAAIDNALWGAVLQETAHARGLTWPHAGCASIDMGKRLPCEMLIAGVAALVTEGSAAVFNANAMERIWPEEFEDFSQRSWRSERDYYNVQRFGGILLLRPLFSEFGAASALAYVAQTPFVVEQGNMRTSALNYQARAREALQNRPAVKDEAGPTAQPVTASRESDSRFLAFGPRDGG